VAKTTKFYRLRARNVRYSTKLQSLSRGMYLTDQNMPEGYAKVLVNYDLDDTGACIKTRKGRSLHKAIGYLGNHKLGRMHITDYIYTYDDSEEEIIDIKDLIMSFGYYGKIKDFLPESQLVVPEENDIPYFVSKIDITRDTNVYEWVEDEPEEPGEGEEPEEPGEGEETPVTGEWVIVEEGEIFEDQIENAWALYCNKGAESFNKVHNRDIGFITARTVKNAYVFDKKLKGDLGLPISAVMNNEVYAFSASPVRATIYDSNSDRDTFDSVGDIELTKLKLVHKEHEDIIKRFPIEPRKLNPTEVNTSGWNILSKSPYLLEDESGGAPRLLGLILYEDSDSDMPILNPTVGKNYSIRAYYQYQTSGATYQYKVETMDATKTNGSYTTVKDWTNFTAGSALWIAITLAYEHTSVRVSIRESGQTTTQSVLPHTFDCGINEYSKFENKEFDLSTAKGMVSWMGCLGVYGVKGAEDTIFFSDIEDPSYFPYPNNTVMFDNEILAVHNYLDMLLVITTDSIVVVTVGETIAKCTQRRVMSNIFIPEVDAVNAIVLKDQIFFKTDTQFYVLKPNKYTSDATDLKNFTNSTAIANYTIHFTEETLKILNRTFRPITNMESKRYRKIVHFTDFDVINIESAVKNEEVHYVYTIEPKIKIDEDTVNTYGYLNIHLVYNTVTRSYRLYLIGVGDENVSHTSKLYRNKQSGAFYEVIPFNSSDNVDSDILIVKEDLDGRDDNIIYNERVLTEYYNNYAYFDTGNVEIDDTYNKRFRELQMNIINRENSKIRFYTDVKVDGKLNVTSTRYEVETVLNPDDPDYGLVYVIPTEVDDLDTMMVAYGNTTLEDEESELTKYWEIDLSAFPDLDTATIKLKLYGKGRRAAFQALCTDLKNYELSTFVWVYRIMNVR